MIIQKWFYYTVCISIVPILTRILLSFFLKSPNELELLNIDDVSFFGLILNITNLNQLENYRAKLKSEKWVLKSTFNSIILLIFFSIIFCLHFMIEGIKNVNFNVLELKYFTVFLSLISLIYSYSIFKVFNIKIS